MQTNINIQLTPDRAEWFVLCEREREYITKCLKNKHNKIERMFIAQPKVFEVINSNVIIDVDPTGIFHNIKVIVNNHW